MPHTQTIIFRQLCVACEAYILVNGCGELSAFYNKCDGCYAVDAV